MSVNNDVCSVCYPTIERLNHLKLATSPRSMYRTLKEQGPAFDRTVMGWIADGQIIKSLCVTCTVYVHFMYT